MAPSCVALNMFTSNMGVGCGPTGTPQESLHVELWELAPDRCVQLARAYSFSSRLFGFQSVDAHVSTLPWPPYYSSSYEGDTNLARRIHVDARSVPERFRDKVV